MKARPLVDVAHSGEIGEDVQGSVEATLAPSNPLPCSQSLTASASPKLLDTNSSLLKSQVKTADMN